MKKWSEQESLWLLENYLKYATCDDITTAINGLFATDRTKESVKQKLRAKGVFLGRATLKPYTEAEDKYLLENCKELTYKQLAEGLHQLSGRITTSGAVAHRLNDMLRESRCGRTGRIKKGDRIGKVCQIGEEYINNDGYVLVKVSDTGVKNADWRTKQTVVWEKLYGESPKGIVVFLNGDRKDFSKENLYCLDRKLHAVMCLNNWYTTDREHTLAAIRWCELFYSIREVTLKEGSKDGIFNKCD